MRFILLILLLASQAFSQRMQAVVAGNQAFSACANPTFTPAAGSYYPGQSVTINLAGGCTGCYTTDGSTPAATTPGTCSTGTTYSTAVSVASSLTLKALATKSGNTNSGVASAAYVIYPNLLTDPTDITQASWEKTASSATNATTWVTAASGSPSLYKATVNVAVSTVYTVTVTGVAVTGGATLNAYVNSSGWEVIGTDSEYLNASDPFTLTFTFNSGADTAVHFTIDTTGLSKTWTFSDLTIHR